MEEKKSANAKKTVKKTTVKKAADSTKTAKATPAKKTVAAKKAPAKSTSKAAPKKTTVKGSQAKKTAAPKKTTRTAPPKKEPVNEQKESPPVRNEFFSQAADMIEEKAKIVGEKTKEFAEDVADKSSGWGKDIFGKFKKGIDSAYEAGVKFAEKAGDSVQDYTDRYKLQAEIRRLKSKKKDDLLEIGKTVYDLYPELGKTTKIIKDENVEHLYHDIKELESTLEKLEKQLEKMEEGQKKA